jgi:phosphate/sulfate permease
MAKRKKIRPWKAVVFWFLGAIFAAVASFIAGNINPQPWNLVKSFIAFMAVLFFFLVAGLLWISVAVAAKESE